MKSLFTFLILITFLFTNCTINQKPEFIGIGKVNIDSFKNNEVKLSVNALFKNNNSFGGTIISDDIQVFTNDIKIGTIEANEFNVPKKDTFSVPLKGVFTAEEILGKNKNDLLSKMMLVLSNKKIELGFKGNLVFKKGVFKYSYSINETDKINLSF